MSRSSDRIDLGWLYRLFFLIEPDISSEFFILGIRDITTDYNNIYENEEDR